MSAERKKSIFTMSAERSESPKSPKFTTAWLGPQIQKVQRDASFIRKNVDDDVLKRVIVADI